MKLIHSVLSRHSLQQILLTAVLTTSQMPVSSAAALPQDNDAAPPSAALVPATPEAARIANVRRLYAKYQRLGIEAMKKNELDAALSMFAQAKQEADLLKGDKQRLLASLQMLALVYQKMGKTTDSIQCEQKIMEILNSNSTPGSDAFKIASMNRIGQYYMEAGDYQNAKSYLQKALALADSIKADSATKNSIIENLTGMAIDSGDMSGAKSYLARLIEFDGKRPQDQKTAQHLEQLGRIQWSDGRLSEATQLLTQAYNIRKSIPNSDEPEMMALLRNLIKANLMLGNTAEPEQDIHKLFAFDRKSLAPNAPDYLCDLLSLADLKLRGGEFGAARVLCDEVIKSQNDSHQTNNSDTADAYSMLARSSAGEKHWLEAKNMAEQAIALRNKLGLPPTFSVNDRETLAQCAIAQGQLADAENNLKQALSIREQKFNNDQVSLARVKAELQNLHEPSTKPEASNVQVSDREQRHM